MSPAGDTSSCGWPARKWGEIIVFQAKNRWSPMAGCFLDALARHVQLDEGQPLFPHRNRSHHASSRPTPVEAPAKGISPQADRAETSRA